MKQKLTILVAARKNSKYLAKFLATLHETVSGKYQIDVQLTINKHDEWNQEIIQSFMSLYRRRDDMNLFIHEEDAGLGRGGLHEYFNYMLDAAQGDWVIYFCEDHYPYYLEWDDVLMSTIMGFMLHGDSRKHDFPLDSTEPWVIAPQFDNCGAMNHVVSRGFIDALDGNIGNHGWIDSYINDLMADFPDRVIRMDFPIFHDFTHDEPNPMDDVHTKTIISEEGAKLPKYDSKEYRRRIAEDKIHIKKALEGLNAKATKETNR